MIMHHVLIDFENIQPSADDLSFFTDECVNVTVFGNAKSNLWEYMDQLSQQFGGRVEKIIMPGSGKNALDFFIAFHIGFVLRDNRKNKVTVLTNDKDLDPLIQYLATTFLGPIERLGKKDIETLRKQFAPPTGFSEASATPGVLEQEVIKICAALPTEGWRGWPLNTILAFTNFIKGVLNDCDLSEQHLTDLLQFMVYYELIVISDNDPERFWYESNNISKAVKGFFRTKEAATNTQTNAEPASPVKKWLEKVCDNLKKRPNTSRPKTLKTLTGTIKDLCKGEQLSNVETVLNFMKEKKLITVTDDKKVTYNLKNFKTV